MGTLLLTSDLAISSVVTGVARRQGLGLVSAFSTAALLDLLAELDPQAEMAPRLVIVDLSTAGVEIKTLIARLREQLPQVRIVAFGPHVHERRLAAAREAGCDEVFSRGQFHRGMDEILAKSSRDPKGEENRVTLCQSIESGALTVEFFHLADRLGHRFVCREGGRRTCWLESIEGNALDHWPPSPALQEVYVETRPDGQRVAMSVGQAGSTHYSASFAQGDRSGSICVDVACRVKLAAGRLASSYRMPAGSRFDSQSNAVVDGSGQRCQIQAQSSGDEFCSVTQREDDPLVIMVEGQIDSIPQTQRPQTQRPQTQRWRYLIWVDR